MKPHIISIKVSGGCISNVHNLPSGVAIRVVDQDALDECGEDPPADDHYDFLGEHVNFTEYDDLLIKAAPELLAECVKLRASIRHASHCKAPSAFPCTCDADGLFESSSAAIAKATQP